MNGEAAIEVARYAYDAQGRLSKKTFGNSRSQRYSYNLRGWLTGISNSVFSETLAYNTSVDGLTPKNPSYTGNISAMRWKYVSTSHDCQYRYDKQSRLMEATYGEGDAVSHQTNPFNEQFSYDLMGNVTSIRRNGKISGSTYGCVDDLVLTYMGNQLKKVTDTGRDGTYSGAFDFEDGADEEIEYEYDKNGNLVKDLNKGISLIEYNCLNLPEKVEMKHQVNSSWVNYGYDGMGRKLYAEYSESLLKSAMPQSSVMDRLQAVYGGSVASSSASSSTSSSSSASGSSGTVSSGQSAASSVTKSTASSTVVKKLNLTSEIQGKSIDRNATTFVSRHNTSRTDYCGNVVYEDSVCRLLFPQGYFTFDETTGKAVPHYFLKDHLGSVRVVMAADGTAEQVNHYYAFGGLMGDSSGGDVQKYKYNGKELDRFLNWDMLDYGARWMDSKLQCWLTVDPLAEKYYHLSPYVYCADNPINAIDPDGKKIVIVGNREERIQVLTIMQRLTNDKLGVNQRGEVMILAHGTKNTAKNLKTGTGLVADVIGNSHTTAIQMGDAGTRNYYHPKFRKNTSNGKGTDGYINLDTSEIPSVVVKDSKSGKSKREKMSTSMVLGHELIHANRAMKGEDYEFDTQITYSYKDVDGKEYQTEEKANELETTGIVGNYIYTENKLRKEQGYNQRIKY